MDEIKLDRRTFQRFKRELRAQYFLKNQSSQYQDCTILDIGRGGMGIQLDGVEALTVGATIFLEIFPLQSLDQINIKGKIKWVFQIENRCVCGIEFDKILDQPIFSKFI